MTKPPDRTTQKLAKEWLVKADSDIRLAEYLLAENTSFWDAAAFHCQQAAEKYLKAFLVRHQVEFPKTHDLRKLLELIAEVDKKLAKSLISCVGLTPYGVMVRYPDDHPRMDRKRVGPLLALAQKVEKAVKNKLKN
jgi:HEPN domain-containing protein